MKGYSREELESGRPQIDPLAAIDFCLRNLYADKKHEVTDYITGNLTFEELIGALLLARDCIGEEETDDE